MRPQTKEPTAIIRWPQGLDSPPDIFPFGGSEETDQRIREKLDAITTASH